MCISTVSSIYLSSDCHGAEMFSKNASLQKKWLIILIYKKPRLWIILTAVVFTLFIAKIGDWVTDVLHESQPMCGKTTKECVHMRIPNKHKKVQSGTVYQLAENGSTLARNSCGSCLEHMLYLPHSSSRCKETVTEL
jgi:hypothetical protein